MQSNFASKRSNFWALSNNFFGNDGSAPIEKIGPHAYVCGLYLRWTFACSKHIWTSSHLRPSPS